MKLKRTGLILKSAALSVGILTASSGVAGQFDGVTLRVATWGGSWKENMVQAIVPKFEALGGKIEFVTGSRQANLAKLIAARGKAHAAKRHAACFAEASQSSTVGAIPMVK